MFFFTLILFMSGALFILNGAHIAFVRRRVESPFFDWRGGKAVAAGLALMVLGAALIYAARVEMSFRQSL